jgi:RNA polymerase sigma factor for flagellar operon FliA
MAAHVNQAVATERNQPGSPHSVSGRQQIDDRERIALEHLPLCNALARRIGMGSNVNGLTADLVSAGMLGLLEAMGKYDESKGVKLISFAYLRVKGAMIDELRKRDWFPRSFRDKANKMEKAARDLELRLSHQPSDEEMAEELGMEPSDYRGRLREIGNLSVVSVEEIEELSGTGPDGFMREMTQDHATAEDYAEKNDEASAVARGISTLPEKQKRVLRFNYYDDMSIKEIAATMGVSESRVSQIRSQGIANLRTVMAKR